MSRAARRVQTSNRGERARAPRSALHPQAPESRVRCAHVRKCSLPVRPSRPFVTGRYRTLVRISSVPTARPMRLLLTAPPWGRRVRGKSARAARRGASTKHLPIHGRAGDLRTGERVGDPIPFPLPSRAPARCTKAPSRSRLPSGFPVQLAPRGAVWRPEDCTRVHGWGDVGAAAAGRPGRDGAAAAPAGGGDGCAGAAGRRGARRVGGSQRGRAVFAARGAAGIGQGARRIGSGLGSGRPRQRGRAQYRLAPRRTSAGDERSSGDGGRECSRRCRITRDAWGSRARGCAPGERTVPPSTAFRTRTYPETRLPPPHQPSAHGGRLTYAICARRLHLRAPGSCRWGGAVAHLLRVAHIAYAHIDGC